MHVSLTRTAAAVCWHHHSASKATRKSQRHLATSEARCKVETVGIESDLKRLSGRPLCGWAVAIHVEFGGTTAPT